MKLGCSCRSAYGSGIHEGNNSSALSSVARAETFCYSSPVSQKIRGSSRQSSRLKNLGVDMQANWAQ